MVHGAHAVHDAGYVPPVDAPDSRGGDPGVGWRLAGLAAAAGCLDAICVARLGGVFASVITGNLVQLGRAVAAVDGWLAAAATTGVAGYALGVAATTTAQRRTARHTTPANTAQQRTPPHAAAPTHQRTHLGAAAGVEAVLLAGVAAAWLIVGADPGRGTALALLALGAAAMGVQSALPISSGGRGASTTYLTGTLTGVVRTAVLDPHGFTAGPGGVARLLALLCGAAAGAVLLRFAPLWAPVPSLLLVAAAATHGWTRRHK